MGIKPKTERNLSIRNDYVAGMRSPAIAKKYEISRSRVQSILRPFGVITARIKASKDAEYQAHQKRSGRKKLEAMRGRYFSRCREQISLAQ